MWDRQIGERVGQLRRQRKLTRAEFGEMIGLSEQYVGRIERGSRIITVAAISKICNVTGVTADYLIFGTEDPISKIALLYGLSRDQVQITLDIAMKVFEFLSTENGNNVLIQEALRRQNTASCVGT